MLSKTMPSTAQIFGAVMAMSKLASAVSGNRLSAWVFLHGNPGIKRNWARH
jgi:hypothetical protein